MQSGVLNWILTQNKDSVIGGKTGRVGTRIAV